MDGAGANALTPAQLASRVIQTFHPTEKLPAELDEVPPLFRQTLAGVTDEVKTMVS